ncbi:MAG: phosphoribosylaminoimidazolesuccinocarboxamide synthase [Clostridiales bacterium]|jgi:phosphoribosylaminoimidazole-succinocarboxamide synthase|nr:phosphoribosylaminoimidazolesuccinocarboxamide synthase [Clostridiales bacterium]
MRIIADGKTKTLYDLENGQYRLHFKDDMTGTDGVFDPGANTVGLTVEGAGRAGLTMTAYFFKLLEEKGCPTHFIDADLEQSFMTVKPATVFGKGLEIICRFTAMGSFVRRYGAYIKEGDPLPAVVEMTLKDDKRDDPLIVRESLEALGIIRPLEYEELAMITKKISEIIRDDLSVKGMKLCDIKLEFGRADDGTILLIDEISGGNMRVLENGKAVEPLELTRKVLR